MNIGIIGYGYWGPNLVRNFSIQSNCFVKIVSDLRPERLAALSKIYPTILTSSDANDIIKSKEIDAVIIATPVSTHYELAKSALLNGKHVLIEKPMTSNAVQAEELILLAKNPAKP